MDPQPQPDDQSVKRRAACDECRVKKLKCTGEHPACARCVREKIPCIYSPQKTMGRPKKRLRHDEGEQFSNGSLLHDSSLSASKTGNTTSSPPASLDLHPELMSLDSLFMSEQNSLSWGLDQQHWFGLGDITSRNDLVPALSSDASSASPSLSSSMPGAAPTSNTTTAAPVTSTDLLLFDTIPKPTPGIGSTSPSCACLSSMYLTLNALQSMDPSFTFPFALHPLREAMLVASNVLTCEQCPQSFLSRMLNTQLLGTLIMGIAERFGKVLQHLTLEAQRSEAAGEAKKFRLADLNTSTSHLHTAGIACAAAFSLNLSAAEWRSMCKKVVRAEVYGPEEGNECCSYLMGIIRQMEDRQERWHKNPSPPDQPKDVFGFLVGAPHAGLRKEDYVCLKIVHYASRLAKGYDWS